MPAARPARARPKGSPGCCWCYTPAWATGSSWPPTSPPETDLLLLDQQHSGLQQIGEHLSRQAPPGGYGGLMLVLPPGQGGSLELGSDCLQQAQLQGCSHSSRCAIPHPASCSGVRAAGVGESWLTPSR
jgi:hypothetical protein